MLRILDWEFSPRYYNEDSVECMARKNGKEVKLTLYKNGLLWAEGKIPPEVKRGIKAWWAEQRR